MKHSAPVMHLRGERDDNDSIDLGQLLGTIWAGRRTILTVGFLAIMAGIGYAYFWAVPIYTATSVVVLDTRKPQVIDLDGMAGGLSGSSDELNTEVEVLRSRGLAGKVVDELNLVTDSEFNSSLRPTTMIDRLRAIIAPQKADRLPAQRTASVVSALLANIAVNNVHKSYVFEISVTSENPAKAATIADSIARRYILNQIEVKFEATEQATTWLANRVSALKGGLEAAEEKVKEFNSQTTLVSPELLAALEVQIKDLRERISQSQLDEVAAKARISALQDATTRTQKQGAANDAALDRIAAGLDADTPLVSQAMFDQRYCQIMDRALFDHDRRVSQNLALEKSRESLAGQISSQGNDLIQLQQLTREAEASRTLYEYFLSRLKETSAQQGIQQADSRLLSAAVVPSSPTQPRKSQVLALCAILGVMLGVGIVLVREALNSGFRAARHLEAETGITIMGQIPVIPGKSRPEILRYLSLKPSSAAMESIRNLRTSLLLSNVDKVPQVIILTSSVPSEGKTTNALALAMNLVGIGKSVLLIEGDIRRNTLNDYFPELKARAGLVSVLSGAKTFDDAVMRPESIGIDVIMGEKSSINAADLFMSESYQTFLAAMRARYDFVIIDTPPVLVVPDARIIAQSADAVLFTVRWDATGRDQVEQAVGMFSSVNQKITGLVLSQIDASQMHRYGYGGKYGDYGVYSDYGAKYYND